MALPWMESVNVWGDEPKKNKPASEAPVRLCVTFSGNGFQSKEWWAKGEGKAMELGRVLEPLKDFRERLLFEDSEGQRLTRLRADPGFNAGFSAAAAF